MIEDCHAPADERFESRGLSDDKMVSRSSPAQNPSGFGAADQQASNGAVCFRVDQVRLQLVERGKVDHVLGSAGLIEPQRRDRIPAALQRQIGSEDVQLMARTSPRSYDLEKQPDRSGFLTGVGRMPRRI